MDIRTFLASRGHVVAIGVSAGLFCAVAAHGALGRDVERDAATVRHAAASATVVSNPAPVFEKPDYSSVTGAWTPGAVASPRGKRAFVSAPKPRLVVNVIGQKKPDPRLERTLPASPVPEATTEPGRVSLRWAPVARGASLAPVSEIRVLRRAPGEKTATAVATLKGDATSWEDSDVKPRAAYEYRLVLAAAQPAKDGRVQSDPSTPVQATCPAGADIRFTGGSEDAAFIAVRKWIGGEWVEQSFSAWPRNEETGRDGAIGGVAVREGKRLDFACGFTLLSIRRETRRFTVPFDERLLQGGQLVVRKTRREMSRECFRIEFTDEAGAKRKLWKEGDLPAGAEPLTDDDR